MNGLNIRMDQFKGLPQDQQLAILYMNTEELKEMIKAYKFNQKIQWGWLGFLTVAVGLTKYIGVF